MTDLIVNVIVALVRIFLPAMTGGSPDTCEDAAPRPELKARLRRRIRETWPVAAAMLVLVVLMPGCVRNHTVYVPHGEPVRLRETVKDAKVWVMNEDGHPVEGVVDLPEGWYVLPLADDPVIIEEPVTPAPAVPPIPPVDWRDA